MHYRFWGLLDSCLAAFAAPRNHVDTGPTGDVLELDEPWSFVQCKASDCWVWGALCRRTRQVESWFAGDRSADSCRQLWAGISEAYRPPHHTYSDFWQAYPGVFGENHQAVGKETGQTAHIERWNNILRQRLARFVRKSLAFSKSNAFHRTALRFLHPMANIPSGALGDGLLTVRTSAVLPPDLDSL